MISRDDLICTARFHSLLSFPVGDDRCTFYFCIVGPTRPFNFLAALTYTESSIMARLTMLRMQHASNTAARVASGTGRIGRFEVYCQLLLLVRFASNYTTYTLLARVPFTEIIVRHWPQTSTPPLTVMAKLIGAIMVFSMLYRTIGWFARK